MEYQFVHTIHGPAVMSEDEVVFFHQVPLMVSYVDEDPEFIEKAKTFLKDEIKRLSEMAIEAVDDAVVGFEQVFSLMNYIHSIEHIHVVRTQAEMPQHGFPGANPS